MSATLRPLAVEVRDVTKSFGGVRALDGVSLDLAEGEVHALLGENGAGKTTLSNILCGLYRADAGEVIVGGGERHFQSPAQAIEAGIGMVHQHFKLVNSMTVAENLHLGSPDTPRVVSARALVASAQRMMDDIGLVVDPTAKVWQLSVGEQQRVEILRVLARGARVLILDEPTAVLAATEADELFAVMRRLVAGGRTVVFISHKLNEVLQVSDRISVLRGGRHVVTREAAGATARELARLMTGEEMGIEVEHREVTGETVLELRGVTSRNSRGVVALHDVDLSVRGGEILGVAGVSGNGQTELAEVVTGLRSPEAGTITIDGVDVSAASTRRIADLGVGHIPEDRIGVGMVASAPVKDNAILRHYRSDELSSKQFLRRDRILAFATSIVEAGRVQTRSVHMPAGQMSGGNQQRLVARRESLLADRLLVAAHPTRGLDVLAAKQVQSAIVERRDAGCAVVMISDDLDELLVVADRVAVMYEGRIMGVFDRASFDREHIGLLMGGRTEAVAG
ncbi:MAG: ABC transporter ATP-binding protein [Acidimicrobiales bacterium]|nr:ABC transporter ATP-binding protein [Acidimicrobiales bacterium]MCB9393391.1 ABC transporter ATP-binding protein [Acidimicrobiaceae bacterium]